MALSPIVSAPSDRHSPSSDDGSISPQTPDSPTTIPPTAQPSESQNTQPQSPSASPTTTQAKRKPSRRANTAERRATHNAVERQRRETLNGRFLDLAALLPNLSQIRRPSKSAIVNSSIAHIHASRRHRLLASRELRLLKLESDALRRELDEWRDRAGLPRVDEPVRGDGFTMVLNGEVEVLATAITEEEDEGQGQFDGFEDADEELFGPVPTVMEDGEDVMATDTQKNGISAHNITAGSTNPIDMKMARMIPRAPPLAHSNPIVAQMPPSVSFENPTMPSLYEPQVASQFSTSAHIGQHGIATPEADKVPGWGPNMYSRYNPQVQMQPQRPMNGVTHSPPSAPAAGFTDYAYFTNLKRQQMLAFQHQHGTMGYSVDVDDASSVGSSQSGHERSGSLSAGSGFSSPPHVTTPPGSYEMSNAVPDFGLGRRNGSNLHVNTTLPGSWCGRGDEGMNGMVIKQSMTPPHMVPNAGGYAIML